MRQALPINKFHCSLLFLVTGSLDHQSTVGDLLLRGLAVEETALMIGHLEMVPDP
jgi:hypothetical protein